MKKLLYIILLLPLWVNAQTNGTIQKTASSGTVRGSFGSLGLDTLPRVTGALVDGYILKYHAATNKWYASPDPTYPGLQDSLNTRVKKTGDTMTGTLNGTDIVLSGDLTADTLTGNNAVLAGRITATGLNSTGQATLGSLNQGGKMNFVSGGTGAVGGTLGFSTNATTNILSLQNIQGVELTSTNSNGYVAVRSTGASGSINFRTGSNINGYVHPSGNWSFQNGGTYTDNGYRIDVNGTGRFTSALTANSFVKTGGTGAQFLMGNGSTQDTTTIQTVSNFFPKGDTRYLRSSTAASTYVPYTGATADLDLGTNAFYGDEMYINQLSVGGAGLTISTTGDVATAGGYTQSGISQNKFTGDSRFERTGANANLRIANAAIGAGIYQSELEFFHSYNQAGSFTAGKIYTTSDGGTTNSSNRMTITDANGTDIITFKNGGAMSILTTPTTSTGSYDALTRNSSTGVVEKVAMSSGTYTPTLTNGTNVASSSNLQAYYDRIGSIVNYTIEVQATTTATGASRLDLSVPIASDFSSVAKSAASISVNLTARATDMQISTDATNNRLVLNWTSASTSGCAFSITGHYVIE